jgi:hypothetical protein
MTDFQRENDQHVGAPQKDRHSRGARRANAIRRYSAERRAETLEKETVSPWH